MMRRSSNYYNNRSVVMMESKQSASRPKGVNKGLKKGPWTAVEDAILIEHVKKHGEGNWNSVQKNSRLMRCGKSCRLRWANHLRPNLKKGSFTPDEERIIIELHAKHGNKWARLASQLPGRTDNEIKNYWNTRMKRREGAGLPVYPQDFQPEAAAAFQFHHQQTDRQQSHVLQPNSSSPWLISSSLYNLSFSLLNPINNNNFLTPFKYPLRNHILSPDHPISFCSNPSDHQLSLFVNTINSTNDGNLPLLPSPSPVSPYEKSPDPSSTYLFNPNPETRQAIPIIDTPPSALLYNNNDADMDNNISFTSLIMMGAHDQVPNLELSSYQTPPGPTTSDGGACAAVLDQASEKININAYEEISTGQQGIMDQGNGDNSGLLDALLQEAKTISSCKGKSIRDRHDLLVLSSNEGKRGIIIKEEGAEDETISRRPLKLSPTNIGSEKLSHDFSSSHSSSIGILKVPISEVEAAGDHDEKNNFMDDELISLLNHFPSTEPLSEWYHISN